MKRPLSFLFCTLLLRVSLAFYLPTAVGAAGPSCDSGASRTSSSSSSSSSSSQSEEGGGGGSRMVPSPPRKKIAVSMASPQSSGSGSGSGSGSESSPDRRLRADAGRLEDLKRQEAELARRLAALRREKLEALRDRPLTIGVIGFGRFGQFIARTFAAHGRVVVTSRSDYTDIANGMGVKYVPLTDPESFLAEDLDVIVVAVSILSFEGTVRALAPHLAAYLERRQQGGEGGHGPLVVDVLSVKEHPRTVLIDLLPPECDILCTHPMFGPDSGKNGWSGLTFVYERTRIDGVLLDQDAEAEAAAAAAVGSPPPSPSSAFVEAGSGKRHDVGGTTMAHVEGMDRMERFLSIWEEEGCRMVPMSCSAHDSFAANSQFITHLMGRILGSQGLKRTPIDTKGFESVLKLVGTTTADSFDLFYGLYKYNKNSLGTIHNLQASLQNVVNRLQEMEEEEEQEQAAKK